VDLVEVVAWEEAVEQRCVRHDGLEASSQPSEPSAKSEDLVRSRPTLTLAVPSGGLELLPVLTTEVPGLCRRTQPGIRGPFLLQSQASRV
jgi:hypothetical protein